MSTEPVTPIDVAAVADRLRFYANHFVTRDWDYTRVHDIQHIRMRGDFSGYGHPFRRVARLVRRFGRRTSLDLLLDKGHFAYRHPIITARSVLATETHIPDGVLDGGGVLVYWEETAEYLQYVQPSVGALIADLLDAHPDLPAVQALAAEMKRIEDRYTDRITSGAVTDRPETIEPDDEDAGDQS